jgi:hypothetical protein
MVKGKKIRKALSKVKVIKTLWKKYFAARNSFSVSEGGLHPSLCAIFSFKFWRQLLSTVRKIKRQLFYDYPRRKTTLAQLINLA